MHPPNLHGAERGDASSARTTLGVAALEAAFRASLARLAPGDTPVLAAVSGGVDSMALLRLLAAVRGRGLRTVEAAYVDHGLRPAHDDEATVRGLAEALGVPLHVRRLGLAAGAGIEARARAGRYRLLDEVRRSRGLALVATAHTASDQAETLLMRLARGASLRGAAGVLEERGDGVVRPLLFASRGEVLAYARARRLGFVCDPMNADEAFLRVRVRQHVLPSMRQAVGPSADKALARFSRLAHEDHAYLQAVADAAWQRICEPDGAVDQVALAALAPPIARRVLARLCDEAQVAVDAAAIDRGLAAVRTGGRATLGADRLLTCRNGRVAVERAPPRRGAEARSDGGLC